MLELDRLDKKLLYELDLDSRQSLSQLARKVKLGSDLVDYRVRKYIDSGLISRFSALVNPFKLGWSVYKTYLKTTAEKAALQEMVKYLDAHPSTYWLTEMYGTWDLLFSFCAKDPHDFQLQQDKVFAKFSKLILDSDVCSLTEIVRSPKNYLVPGSKRTNRLEQSADKYEMDELESSLLGYLARDARMSIVELAERTNSTPTVVKYRVQKLEAAGVIVGYNMQFDYSIAKMILFKVLISRGDITPSAEKELREFCIKNPQIVVYVRQIGRHTSEFEAEVPDYDTFHGIMDDFKEQFGATVRSVEHLVIRRDYFHRIPAGL